MAEYGYENLPVNEIKNEMGVIGARTKVKGNVKTDGHITILGLVQGDVIAKGNVVVAGNVEGNIKCTNLMIEAVNLTANVNASGTVIVKEGKGITGEISCQNITIAGTVEGKIDAKDRIGLASTANVSGDIKAQQIATDLGAKIKGSMMIG